MLTTLERKPKSYYIFEFNDRSGSPGLIIHCDKHGDIQLIEAFNEYLDDFVVVDLRSLERAKPRKVRDLQEEVFERIERDKEASGNDRWENSDEPA